MHSGPAEGGHTQKGWWGVSVRSYKSKEQIKGALDVLKIKGQAGIDLGQQAVLRLWSIRLGLLSKRHEHSSGLIRRRSCSEINFKCEQWVEIIFFIGYVIKYKASMQIEYTPAVVTFEVIGLLFHSTVAPLKESRRSWVVLCLLQWLIQQFFKLVQRKQTSWQ